MQERVWPVYLGAPSRAGTPESLAADPQPVWRASLSRGIVGAPALTEELIAVSLADHRVALLERATGQVIWTRRVGLALGAGPIIADDRIFVAEQTPGGRVYALKLSSGSVLWDARGGDVAAPLASDDSSLFVGTIEGWVGRIDPANGRYTWRVRLPGAVRAAPVPLGGTVLVATATDSIFLLDRANGAIRARRATRGTVLAAPAVVDSTVIIGTSAGRLEAMRAGTLRTLWSMELQEPIMGSIAVQEGRVYALTGRGTLAILGVRDTTLNRLLHLGIVSRAGPTPTAQGIYVTAVNGEITLVDSSGTRRWTTRLDAPLAEPVIADQRTLVAVSMRGDMVTYR